MTAVDILFQEEHGLHWYSYGDKKRMQITNQIRSLYRSMSNDRDPMTTASTIPRYAGFWTRYFALCIDGILLALPGIVVVKIFSILLDSIIAPGTAREVGTEVLASVSVVFTWAIYFPCMESSSLQATLGKMLFGIRVTDLEGRRISFGRAAKRLVWKFVSIMLFYVGLIMAAFTQKKQGLHDIMSGCLVVEAEERKTSP